MRVYHAPSIAHLRRAAGRNSACVFRIRNGVTDLYEKRNLPNPNTSEQQLSRGAWSQSCAAWRELAADGKLAWDRYARANVGSFVGRQSAEPLTGNRLFQAAAGNLQILGLPIPVEAPSQPPPEGLRKVELLPTAEGDTLRLRVEHELSGSGYRVLVSMSPATLRPSRKADRRSGRLVCGWGAGSTALLPVSGGEIVFTGCRYSVEPGKRFGVWVRVVRENDGLGSVEMFLDFIRPEPEGIAATEDRGPLISRIVARKRRGTGTDMPDAFGLVSKDLTKELGSQFQKAITNCGLAGSKVDSLIEITRAADPGDSTISDLCHSPSSIACFRNTKTALNMQTLLSFRSSILRSVFMAPGAVQDVDMLDEIPMKPGAT